LGDILVRAGTVRKALGMMASATDEKAQEAALAELNQQNALLETLRPGAPAGARQNVLAYFNAKANAETDEKKKAEWLKKAQPLTDPLKLAAEAKAAPLPDPANPATFGALVNLLADADGSVAQSASYALSRLKGSAAGALLAKLASQNDAVAYHASNALAKIGRDLVPQLTALAVNGNPAARWAAVTLGEIGDARAATVLETLKSAPDPDTANAAEIALAKVKI
jgi:HEAT repeat protein